MTLLRDIQQEATTTAVPLSTLLRRAQTLAFRLSHEPLKEWARNELEGYQDPGALPDYRDFGEGQLPIKGEFAQAAGGIWSNMPIAPSQVPDFARDRLCRARFMQGVAEYEALLATGREEFPMPWTGDEVAIMRRVLPGLLSAAQMVPSNAVAGMLDQVRNRLLAFSLEIAQQNPEAGEAEPGTEPVAAATVTNIFHNTIWGDHNVVTAAAGDAAVTVNTTRVEAAWPELLEQLEEAGLPADEIERLEAALRADGDPTGTELGPLARSWVGHIAERVGTGTLVLAQGVTVEMIVHQITHALGLA